MGESAQTINHRIIGLISDTHGYLDPSAIQALKKADMIIHAGDIGKPDILGALRQIAPVTAVRGNMDGGAWARSLPRTDIIEIGDVFIYVLHDINDLDLDPPSASIHAVVSGHLHRPSIAHRNGVLYVNPGSATLPRQSLPSVALIDLRGDRLHARIIELNRS